MGHYDEFYQNDDEALWKIAAIMALEENEKECLKELTERDYEQWTLIAEHSKKDTANKPKDARYCFLNVLADRDDLLLRGVGTLLDSLVHRIEENDNKESVLKVLSLLKHHILDVARNEKLNIIEELIALRADVLRIGKYKKDDYKEKIDISLLLDAAARHYIKYVLGTVIDEESGHSHLAHLLANVVLIRYQVENYYIN